MLDSGTGVPLVWFHPGVRGLVWSVVVNDQSVVVQVIIFGGESEENLWFSRNEEVRSH